MTEKNISETLKIIENMYTTDDIKESLKDLYKKINCDDEIKEYLKNIDQNLELITASLNIKKKGDDTNA